MIRSRYGVSDIYPMWIVVITRGYRNTNKAMFNATNTESEYPSSILVIPNRSRNCINIYLYIYNIWNDIPDDLTHDKYSSKLIQPSESLSITSNMSTNGEMSMT